MENKHKQFKPYDRVLVRTTKSSNWDIDFYSYFNNAIKTHITLNNVYGDNNILPYEGNEHLLGTTDEPEEDIKLEEGERAVFSDILNRIQEGNGVIDTFESVSKLDCYENQFKTPNGYYYQYCIKFSDFNPNDMEETRKHILCVKNGKVVKYKE